jgi:hypothetical protein
MDRPLGLLCKVRLEGQRVRAIRMETLRNKFLTSAQVSDDDARVCASRVLVAQKIHEEICSQR